MEVTTLKGTSTTISDSADTLIGTIPTAYQNYVKLIFDITKNNTTDFKIFTKVVTVEDGDVAEPQILSMTSAGIACYQEVHIFNRDVTAEIMLDLKGMAYQVKVYIRATTEGTPAGTLNWIKYATLEYRD